MNTLEEKLRSRNTKGIVYLSHVPNGYTIAQISTYLGNFGKIGRAYFRPDDKKQKRKRRIYCEGWVEFDTVKEARHAESMLNNQLIMITKSSESYTQLWNIIFMPNLIWTDINAKEAEIKSSQFHRMRQEIFKARKLSNYYTGRIDSSTNLRRAVKNDKNFKRIENSNKNKKQLQFKQKRVSFFLFR
ncbi:Pre-rRNA-processing protein ESF2 [Intoshia linei]|uniref:Pre-rRNA-processing protein ESF2 n=1 Tax=Intoshia linei TaxID=1819745 RepID=A0A177AVA2_9BILA|nr:Pre-rRNA-processing protein ESF2 [Intoshia linei]